MKKIILSILCLAALIGIAQASVLFSDFTGSQLILVTNEYAHWNPNDSKSIKSPKWDVTSGSLFAMNGMGYTGKIDNANPNPTSSNGTDSAVFRAVTKYSFANGKVSFNLSPVAFGSTPTTPPVSWDGMHIFLRYQSEYSLYYASVLRRDGNIVIKKKCPGGPSNGGTYYDLSPYVKYTPQGQVSATIQTQNDGSVRIQIVDSTGKVLVSGIDKGTQCPIIPSGSTGIRGDNLEFYFSNFKVENL